MTSTGPTLFDLLPALHRARDAERGAPLRALLELIENELSKLRDDIDGLYDDWFIETCEDWVVPYLGELLGVHGLEEMPGARVSRRAFVANTIGYRRRKGTVGVLEDLARDATGWPARAVEYFQLLGWTQHVNHVRPLAGGTVSLHDANALELVDGPFDTTAHTVDVRHVDNGRGDHNLPNVGIHLWRLIAHPLRRSTARRVAGSPALFAFDPFGSSLPIRNPERPEPDRALAQEHHVPGRVRRRALHAELVQRAADADFHGGYFDVSQPVLEVHLDGADTPAPVRMCSLDVPDRPVPPGVSVDPERGLIRVEPAAAGIEVSWAYGAAGNIGGGPYERGASLGEVFDGAPEAIAGVHARSPSGAAATRPTIAEALALIPATASTALVAIMDSRTYTGPATLAVGPGRTRAIAAGRWPAEDPDLPPEARTGAFAARDVRPHVVGDIEIAGSEGDETVAVLDGLAIEGHVRVRGTGLDRLRIAHCTIRPPDGDPAIVVEGAGPELTVEIERCLTGPVDVAGAARLTLTDSIVVGRLSGAVTRLECCTVLGDVAVRELHASESILDRAVDVERRQRGCVRFSYVGWDERVPRRFRCVPATAADRARPLFVAERLGDEALGVLRTETSEAILAGAEDGDQMGALHFVQERQRLRQLQWRLEEYLRLGLEVGTFLVTQDRKGI